ncbi:TniB family NTP-binding protein [Undibacterium flavidum]|uniref:TniB family NTP-binding protein n=1 Tax=Undibacterium flavidum TaxID=2762297 RepID=A0ABR6YA92_9BURK|nr:TniB family NTP-binding protein [Undibacterium flavidum]MBC3873503.1 TniB family NTP-binding protein [Undibacterium flavidum]
MSDFPHLNAETQNRMRLSRDERIFLMNQDQWVGYSHARMILDRMEELLNFPRISRMPNMLLVGSTNNGKTQILKRFRELHPGNDNLGEEAISVPVVYVQAPAVPDEKRLYADILNTLFAKYSVSDHPHKLLSNVKDKFSRIGVRMLIIDELNSILSGSSARQRQFLTVLKHLSNELQIPIVAAGTEDAIRAIKTDRQLENRFNPMILPKWGFDTEFRRFLASYEQMLPLSYPSNLSEKILAHDIWARAEGTIGETVTLLKASARYAISNGIEKIDIDVLDKSGYEKPSARRKALKDH